MLTLDSNCCTAGVHVHSNRLVQAVIFLSLLRVGMCVCGVGGGGGWVGGHERVFLWGLGLGVRACFC